MDRAYSMNEVDVECIQIGGGKPEGKRPQGKPQCRWLDNIKMNIRGVG
jgi:hypothetical protein